MQPHPGGVASNAGLAYMLSNSLQFSVLSFSPQLASVHVPGQGFSPEMALGLDVHKVWP